MLYHGSGTLSDLNAYVRKTCEVLKPCKSLFDCIVVTGMSGVILGSPVALRLHKPLVVLRKEDDKSTHCYSNWINIENAGSRYLILDDFIASGRTFHRIREHADYEGLEYAGAYMYGDDVLSWDGDGIITYHPSKATNEHTYSWGIATVREAAVEDVCAGEIEFEDLDCPPVTAPKMTTYGTAADLPNWDPAPYPVKARFVCDEDKSLTNLRDALCGDPGKGDTTMVASDQPGLFDFSHYTAKLTERTKRVAEWEREHEPDADERVWLTESTPDEFFDRYEAQLAVRVAKMSLPDWAERQVAAYRNSETLEYIQDDATYGAPGDNEAP